MKLSSQALAKIIIMALVFGVVVSVMGEEPKIIGVWDYNLGKEKFKVIIAEEDDETVLIKKFDNGIRIKQVVIEGRRSDGVVFKPEDENIEEYYLVDKSGNMQIWDVMGAKATLKTDQ